LRAAWRVSVLVLACLAAPAHALQAGDILFSSYNADNDSVAIVALTNLAANQTLFLTDNEWTGAAFNSGESYFAWNTGSGVAAGSVVSLSAFASGAPLASAGALSRVNVSGNTSAGLSQTAETLYLYEGASATAPSRFVTAITSGDLTATSGSLQGTDLSVGSTALQLRYGSDSADYTGARRGLVNVSSYAPLLADIANWQDRGDGNYSALAADLTALNAPIPEPTSVWLALAGLGVLGAARRRRARPRTFNNRT
jgi:hypothetical protein